MRSPPPAQAETREAEAEQRERARFGDRSVDAECPHNKVTKTATLGSFKHVEPILAPSHVTVVIEEVLVGIPGERKFKQIGLSCLKQEIGKREINPLQPRR